MKLKIRMNTFIVSLLNLLNLEQGSKYSPTAYSRKTHNGTTHFSKVHVFIYIYSTLIYIYVYAGEIKKWNWWKMGRWCREWWIASLWHPLLALYLLQDICKALKVLKTAILCTPFFQHFLSVHISNLQRNLITMALF